MISQLPEQQFNVPPYGELQLAKLGHLNKVVQQQVI